MRWTYGKEDRSDRFVVSERTERKNGAHKSIQHIIHGSGATSLPFGSTLVQLCFIVDSTYTMLRSIGCKLS